MSQAVRPIQVAKMCVLHKSVNKQELLNRLIKNYHFEMQILESSITNVQNKFKFASSLILKLQIDLCCFLEPKGSYSLQVMTMNKDWNCNCVDKCAVLAIFPVLARDPKSIISCHLCKTHSFNYVAKTNTWLYPRELQALESWKMLAEELMQWYQNVDTE